MLRAIAITLAALLVPATPSPAGEADLEPTVLERVSELRADLETGRGLSKVNSACYLARLGVEHDAAFDALLSAFRSGDPETRLAGLRGLSLLPTRAGDLWEDLESGLGDGDPLVRLLSARTLDLGCEEHRVVADLLEMTLSTDEETRRAGIDGLYVLEDPPIALGPALVTAVRYVKVGRALNRIVRKDSETVVFLLSPEGRSKHVTRCRNFICEYAPPGTPGVLEHVRERMVRGNEYDRALAVRTYSRMAPDPEEAIDRIAGLLASREVRVREAAVNALGSYGALALRTAPLLREHLATDDPIRIQAAQALRRIGANDPETVSQVAAQLSDANPKARRAAARALGAMGPSAKSAVPALLRRTGDADRGVRRAASAAVLCIAPEEIRDPWTVVELPREHFEAAVAVLVRIGSEPDAPLAEMFESVCIGGDRLFTASLRRTTPYPGKMQLATLLAVIRGEHGAGREIALDMIGRLGANAAPLTPALIGMLDDRKRRLPALEALGRIGPAAADAAPAVAECMKSRSEDLAPAAARTMARLGRAAVPHLIDILEDARLSPRDPRDPPVNPWRQGSSSPPDRAAEALGAIGPDAAPAIPVLARRALAGHYESIVALGALGSAAKRAVPALIPRAKLGEIESIEALGRIGPDAHAALNALVCVLALRSAPTEQDPEKHWLGGRRPWVESRIAAARALARIDPGSSVAKLLRSAAEDPDPDLREAARAALRELSGGR